VIEKSRKPVYGIRPSEFVVLQIYGVKMTRESGVRKRLHRPCLLFFNSVTFCKIRMSEALCHVYKITCESVSLVLVFIRHKINQ
jgi:hypothetical protein